MTARRRIRYAVRYRIPSALRALREDWRDSRPYERPIRYEPISVESFDAALRRAFAQLKTVDEAPFPLESIDRLLDYAALRELGGPWDIVVETARAARASRLR